jgi:hypothetical protein
MIQCGKCKKPSDTSTLLCRACQEWEHLKARIRKSFPKKEEAKQ